MKQLQAVHVAWYNAALWSGMPVSQSKCTRAHLHVLFDMVPGQGAWSTTRNCTHVTPRSAARLRGSLAKLADVSQAPVQRGPGAGVAGRVVGDHEQLGRADHARQQSALGIPARAAAAGSAQKA